MYVRSTDSTNTLLKQMAAEGNPPEFIFAGYQTAGRGQTGNSWESEEGENLICSILLPPNKNLYFLNIAVGVAIYRTMRDLGISEIGIKWPNDIYWKDKKLAGILIENAIIGNEVKYSIAGIGLNVNQTEFKSDAPNPVSLKQITGKEYDIERLTKDLLDAIHTVLKEPEEAVWLAYKAHLYRREGWYTFEDKNGPFEATIQDVLPTGELVLEDQEWKLRTYPFKQVRYVI